MQILEQETLDLGSVGEDGQPQRISALALAESLRSTTLFVNVRELQANHRLRNESHFGLISDIDSSDLAVTGWGVVFPAEINEPLRDALEPLLDHRRRQANAQRMRYHELRYQIGERHNTFLARHGVALGPVDPDRGVPYFLLLIGSPSEIPYAFQRDLGLYYAVGRIWFSTIDEYRRYAEAVVQAELANGLRQRSVGLFTPHLSDGEQHWLTAALSQPGGIEGWRLTKFVGGVATKVRLREIIEQGLDALLLIDGPTVASSFASGRKGTRGAPITGEWTGSSKAFEQPIPPDGYFSIDDLGPKAKLSGSVIWMEGAFSAGDEMEPHLAAFNDLSVGALPTISQLAQRMLSLKSGGALAVVGRIGASFPAVAANDLRPDQEAASLALLRGGKPVGAVVEDVFANSYVRHAIAVSEELEDLKFGKLFEPSRLARLWAAMCAVRGYVVFGDPAVRLITKDPAGPTGAERPTAQQDDPLLPWQPTLVDVLTPVLRESLRRAEVLRQATGTLAVSLPLLLAGMGLVEGSRTAALCELFPERGSAGEAMMRMLNALGFTFEPVVPDLINAGELGRVPIDRTMRALLTGATASDPEGTSRADIIMPLAELLAPQSVDEYELLLRLVTRNSECRTWIAKHLGVEESQLIVLLASGREEFPAAGLRAASVFRDLPRAEQIVESLVNAVSLENSVREHQLVVNIEAVAELFIAILWRGLTVGAVRSLLSEDERFVTLRSTGAELIFEVDGYTFYLRAQNLAGAFVFNPASRVIATPAGSWVGDITVRNVVSGYIVRLDLVPDLPVAQVRRALAALLPEAEGREELVVLLTEALNPRIGGAPIVERLRAHPLFPRLLTVLYERWGEADESAVADDTTTFRAMLSYPPRPAVTASLDFYRLSQWLAGEQSASTLTSSLNILTLSNLLGRQERSLFEEAVHNFGTSDEQAMLQRILTPKPLNPPLFWFGPNSQIGDITIKQVHHSDLYRVRVDGLPSEIEIVIDETPDSDVKGRTWPIGQVQLSIGLSESPPIMAEEPWPWPLLLIGAGGQFGDINVGKWNDERGRAPLAGSIFPQVFSSPRDEYPALNNAQLFAFGAEGQYGDLEIEAIAGRHLFELAYARELTPELLGWSLRRHLYSPEDPALSPAAISGFAELLLASNEETATLDAVVWRLSLAWEPAAPTQVGIEAQLTLMARPVELDDTEAATDGAVVGLIVVPTRALDLIVYVDAPGFYVSGKSPLRIPLFRSGAEVRRSIVLRATELGSQDVIVEVYAGDREAGLPPARLMLPSKVSVPDPSLDLPQMPEVSGALPIPHPEPEVTLFVSLERRGSNEYLHYAISCPTLGLRAYTLEPLPLNRGDLAALRDLALEAASNAGAAPDDTLVALKGVGTLLFQRLMPEGHALRDHYYQIAILATESHVRWTFLVVAKPAALLPWELLYPLYDEERPNAERFLGASFAVCHWPGGQGLTLLPEAPVALLDLAASDHRDAERWRGVLGGPAWVITSGDGQYAPLGDPISPCYGLHVVRYADYDGESRVAAIDEPLSPSGSAGAFVEDRRLDVTMRRPVVSLSLIELDTATMRAHDPDTRLEAEWALPFLRAGAAAFVGPRWPTTADADRRFVRSLYTQLRAGIPLGPAVWAARRRVRQALPGRPDWLAYAAFGHPRCEPYQVEATRGFTLFEILDHPDDAPLIVRRHYLFRASYRTEAPAGYNARLHTPAALSDEVCVIVAPLTGGETSVYALDRKADGDYSADIKLQAPDEFGEFPLLVRFVQGNEELSSLLLELSVELEP